MVDGMIAGRALAALFAMSCSAAGGAQVMNDPTRPPLNLTGAAGVVVASNPLQSILISSGRKGAIIEGQYVPLGGKHGDARLIDVSATQVTLKGPDKTEVLKLFPDNGKAPVLPQSPAMGSFAGRRP